MSGPLDYLRSSPVRGQLEPYDPKTRMGWRFIQTTDTLNEFKVLLPPGTAAMYEQLLKLETYELTKKSISWDRILEIRHLKDRMIRKCQKLAKTTVPSLKPSAPFQTFIAPEDFRVREMEKWFREQQKRANAVTARRTLAQAPVAQIPIPAAPIHNHAHAQCIHWMPGQPPSRSLPLAGKLSLSKSNLQQPVTNSPAISKMPPKPGMHTRTQTLTNISQRALSLPMNQTQAMSSTRPSVVSPPPLPVLLRGQRSEFGLDDEFGQPESAQGDPALSESTENEAPPLAGSKDSLGSVKERRQEPKSSPQSSGDETPPVPGEIRRRRSCIRNSSMSELGAKTVSWADGQEWDNQISRYAATAREAQASGSKWEEIRTIYLDQINGLGTLQERIREGLDSLKTESEHLHRVDDTIRRQREQLRRTFDELERTQSLFNEKVQEALEQADNVMSRHGLRKNSHLVANE